MQGQDWMQEMSEAKLNGQTHTHTFFVLTYSQQWWTTLNVSNLWPAGITCHTLT